MQISHRYQYSHTEWFILSNTIDKEVNMRRCNKCDYQWSVYIRLVYGKSDLETDAVSAEN